MSRNRTFKVLCNLILLAVFCTGQVAAAPNNSATNKVERNSSSSNSSIFVNNEALTLDPQISPQPLSMTGETISVSVSPNGTQGNQNSWYSSISSDGRYIAFESNASNLVNGDTNGSVDVFVRDIQMGVTTRVSVDSNGAQSGGGSGPSISADGRFIAFASGASNLVSGDTNWGGDIFLHDMYTGNTIRVSVSSDGAESTYGRNSESPKISADGRFIAFASGASNLVSDDTNGIPDIFVHDTQTGITTRVSVASNGTQQECVSGCALNFHAISANGRYIAFTSKAGNLVNNDTNDAQDIFVHDMQTGEIKRLSVANNGEEGNSDSVNPSLSNDGRYVAFASYASNLVSGDTNGAEDVFVHDTQTNTTTRVSLDSSGTQGNIDSGISSPTPISADGRYVAFESGASNLVSGDLNYRDDIFLRDTQTNTTTRVSLDSSGQEGNNSSYVPSISADGRYVAFASLASNLVNGDTNGWGDVFVHENDVVFSISGRVVDDRSNGIVSVSVSDGAGHTVSTDSNGNYTLSGLAAGTYTIAPSKSGYTFSPASRAITVPPNKTGYDFVAIPLPPQTSVPFFSQRDGRWKNHPLQTNGACSSTCNTIGACGCTLTSAAMVFSYYGANLNPSALSDCMGKSACPFAWGTGASCTDGKATFVGRYGFGWIRLDQELNQNHRPVILGMHKKGHPDATHWVVVVSGQGNEPANYSIHDPWFLGGANMKLSALTRNYDLDKLSVYSGQPSYSGMSSATLGFSVMPQVILSASSSIVTGTVLIYNMTEVAMTVQLIAQSSAGNITEMLVWTDEITNPSWQPFSTLIELPVSDYVYARFRDEFGNESGQTSDTIYPVNTPLNPLLNIFLPMILK